MAGGGQQEPWEGASHPEVTCLVTVAEETAHGVRAAEQGHRAHPRPACRCPGGRRAAPGL